MTPEMALSHSESTRSRVAMMLSRSGRLAAMQAWQRTWREFVTAAQSAPSHCCAVLTAEVPFFLEKGW